MGEDVVMRKTWSGWDGVRGEDSMRWGEGEDGIT